MTRTLERGVAITTFLSVLSVVPRHRAHLIYSLHPELREIDAVLITLKPMTLSLRRRRRAVSAPRVLQWR